MVQTTIQNICAVDGYKKRFLNWVNGRKLLLFALQREYSRTAEVFLENNHSHAGCYTASPSERKHAKIIIEINLKKEKKEKVLQLYIYMSLSLFSPIRFVASSTNYIMYTVCEQLDVGLVWTGKNFYFPHETELICVGDTYVVWLLF